LKEAMPSSIRDQKSAFRNPQSRVAVRAGVM
jgi:hypothetical protein